MPRITKGDVEKLLRANERLRRSNQRLREQVIELPQLKKALAYRIKYGDGVENVRRARQRNLRLITAFDNAKQIIAAAISAEMNDLHNESVAERRNGS